jgi:hypothetical protein
MGRCIRSCLRGEQSDESETQERKLHENILQRPKILAVANPIPSVPPVTTATFSSSFLVIPFAP